MIAISSGLDLWSRDRQDNKFNASVSWNRVFSNVIFLSEGPSKYPKEWDKEECIPISFRPTIKYMAGIASNQKEWSCLINADIIVSPRLKLAENALNKLSADCAFSMRIPVDGFRPVDLGLDFFCARPEVWKLVAGAIPEQFLIGKQQWDTWLMSFLAHNYPETFYDLTPSKLIYHPNHEDRGDQSIEIVPDKYLKDVRWAKKQLTV